MYIHSLLRADVELQLKTESSLDLVRSRPDTVLHVHVVRRRQLGHQKTPHPNTTHHTTTLLTTPTHHTHSPHPLTTPTHHTTTLLTTPTHHTHSPVRGGSLACTSSASSFLVVRSPAYETGRNSDARWGPTQLESERGKHALIATTF